LNLALQGKKVLVAGGGGGLGTAMCNAFAAEGAEVFSICRNRPNFEQSGIHWQSCDITNKSECNKLAAELLELTHNQLDVLICNVGSGRGKTESIPDDSEWQRLWDINFSGTLNFLRLFENALDRAGGNAILVGSIAGLEKVGSPTPYSVAKSAIVTLGKELSHKWGPNVRVNVIAPGNIYVEGGVWDMKMKENPIAVHEMLEQEVPLRRFGKPQEIADLALFISSEKAAFITGSCIVIDGGQTTFLH
jgi:3-oxoacyl-[acyl-carrier protein] reductase